MSLHQHLEEIPKRFDEQLVGMNLYLGRDMHNRPPLYDMNDDRVQEIKDFLLQSNKETIEKVIEEVRMISTIYDHRNIENLADECGVSESIAAGRWFEHMIDRLESELTSAIKE